MKLIISLTSPYARKARIVAQEKQLTVENVIDIPWNADTNVPNLNPLGKIPVLILDDGDTLFDSRVIVEYMDRLSPVGKLLPQDTRPQTRVKRWEALADGICDAAVTIFLEKTKRAADKQDPDWIARQEEKIHRALQVMSEQLADKTWCVGEGFTLADIATGCALGYLDLRFTELNWKESYPNLARHFQKLSERQSFIDTLPPA
ncbi:glutathione S-transferase [Leeia sp. TBRC 13508]|uniref:Glutathione S-transferase n=1 Tax=Leeia speluncae TaxID=2884804 RepID=A0ABS8D7P2_9NEIS|nr:glutathione S-transferase [Leeia speluncae]MCB6184167.1 glutathione S-transferase [Leeia speluncae]